MTHHKRKGPKSTRAGCLLCKPHKGKWTPRRERQRFGVNRKLAGSHAQLQDAGWSRRAGREAWS